MPCSPINAPQDHEMHPCGLTTLEIAICKSRPGKLLSSAGSVGVCLSCTGKRWASVLVRKWSVFQNTVTYLPFTSQPLVLLATIVVRRYSMFEGNICDYNYGTLACALFSCSLF